MFFYAGEVIWTRGVDFKTRVRPFMGELGNIICLQWTIEVWKAVTK